MDPRLLIHPGEVLKEEFLVPLGLSSNRLAKAIGVPTNRITEIVNGTRGITGETAVLLGHAFGTTPEFWLNLQSRYELDVANTRSAGRDPPRGCLSSRIANCVTVGWIAGAAPAMVALRFREDFRHRHH